MNIRRFLICAIVTPLSLLLAASASLAATINLGFMLDGSGSISNADFTRVTNALASALSVIPVSGGNSYRIAVSIFGADQITIVAPTILTADNLSAIQSAIASAGRPVLNFTNTAAAITQMAALFGSFMDDLTLLNITTDGLPTQAGMSTQTAAQNAIDAAAAAVAAGVDGISVEAVGDSLNSAFALNTMQQIAQPQPSVLVTDLSAIPDPLNAGFVILVPDFDDYDLAINAKLQKVVDETTPQVPLPAALPLLALGLGALGLLGRPARRNPVPV